MNAVFPLAVIAGLAQPPAPALHADQPLAALGPVKAGPPARHTFDLTHRGAAGILTVTAVESGCGCVRQNLTTGVLRPGDSTKLTLEVNTLTQPDGPNRWWARVRYQVSAPPVPGRPDPPPETGAVELYITAVLSREVTVEPAQLALSGAGEITHSLKVTDRRGKPLGVVRAVGSAPYLTGEIGPPAGGVQQVVLKLAADAPPGLRDETVTLHTNDPDYPELRVPVRVNRRPAGGAVAYPDRAVVRPTPGQAEASVLVQVRRADGAAVAVEKVECDHPAVAAKWSPGSGPVATLRFTLTAATAGTAGATEARVRLSEPAGQVLVVPVSW